MPTHTNKKKTSTKKTVKDAFKVALAAEKEARVSPEAKQQQIAELLHDKCVAAGADGGRWSQ